MLIGADELSDIGKTACSVRRVKLIMSDQVDYATRKTKDAVDPQNHGRDRNSAANRDSICTLAKSTTTSQTECSHSKLLETLFLCPTSGGFPTWKIRESEVVVALPAHHERGQDSTGVSALFYRDSVTKI